MPELKNEFSWSHSRENSFNDCKRRYYYNYYGNWGGWKADAPKDVRDAYVLKQLKSRFMWIGEVIHDAAAEMLRSLKRSSPIDQETLMGLVRSRMRSDWTNSRDRRYWITPKSCGLMEHEYDQEVSKERWQELMAQAETCVQNFYASPILERIRKAGPMAWKSLEELKSFQAQDIKVFVKLDFAFTDENQRLLIVDWKTGKSKDTANKWQLSIYGLFVTREWRADPAMVRTMEYNLVRNEGEETALSPEAMAETEDHILESARAMKALLADPKNNTAVKDNFPMTDDKNLCKNCNYQRLCYPERYVKSYTF